MSMRWSKAELVEAQGIIQRVAPWILASMQVKTGQDAARLRQFIGDLVLNGIAYIDDSTLTTRVSIYMTMARDLGASYTTMAQVRAAASEEAPVGIPAIAVKFLFVVMSLALESVILMNTSFKSSDEAGVVADAYMVAFDAAAEEAADTPNVNAYMKIIMLKGALAQYFAERGRRLPRIVAYEFAKPLPALVMAHKLYQDASRAQELIDENHIINPVFCPVSGSALAV